MAIALAFNAPQFIDEYEGYKMRMLVDELDRLHAALTRDIDEEGVSSTVDSFNGRVGTVVPLQADYDSFFLTQAEGDALYAASSHNHSTSQITDFDLTGAADNDLLFRSGGNWIDTAGNLTWTGSELGLRSPSALDTMTIGLDNLDANITFASVRRLNLIGLDTGGIDLNGEATWSTSTNSSRLAGTVQLTLGYGGSSVAIQMNGSTGLRLSHLGQVVQQSTSRAAGGMFLYNDLTQNTGGLERILTQSDVEAGQFKLVYGFNTSIAATDPGTGSFKANNAAIASATELYIDDLSNGQLDATRVLSNIAAGDILRIGSVQDETIWLVATAGTPVDNTGWWTIPITVISSSGANFSNHECVIDVQWVSVLPSGIEGSIADNQIAFGAATANEIEGDANLTWDGTTLGVAGGVTISNGADSGSFSHNGTDFLATFVNTGELQIAGADLALKTGADLVFYDNLDADSIRFSHDNTDFNIVDEGSTRHVEWQGFAGLHFFSGFGLAIEQQTSQPYTLGSYSAIWADTTMSNIDTARPRWNTDTYLDLGTIYPTYRFESTVAAAAADELRLNSGTQSAATEIRFGGKPNNWDSGFETLFAQIIETGDTIYLFNPAAGSRYQIYTVSGAVTDSGAYGTLPVTWVSGGSLLLDNYAVVMYWEKASPAGVADGTATGNTLYWSGSAWVENANVVWNPTNSNLVLPSDSDALTPTLAFGNGDTGFYEQADDTLRVAIAGNALWQFDATSISGSSSASGALLNNPSSTLASVRPHRSRNMGFGTAASTEMSIILNGTEFIKLNDFALLDSVILQFPLQIKESAGIAHTTGYGQIWTGFDGSLNYKNDTGTNFVLTDAAFIADGTVDDSLMRWNDTGGTWDEIIGLRVTDDHRFRVYDQPVGTDYIELYHDAIDAQFNFGGTANVDFDGYTGYVQFRGTGAGVLIYDSDDSATLFLAAGDGTSFITGTGVLQLSSSGTSVQIANGKDFWLRGGDLKVYDNSVNYWAQLSHDGTHGILSFDGVATVGFNINDVPVYLEERAAAGGNQTGYGQLWAGTDNSLNFTDEAGTNTILTAASSGITQLTGDVTAGPGSGSQAATIANSAVTNAKMADMAANTVKYRGAGLGAPQDLAIPVNTVFGRQGGATLCAQVVTAQIQDDNVTYAKIQNVVSANTLLGSLSAGGIVTELTGTQVNTFLPSFTSTLNGLVPLSGGGTTNYLRADGTWAAPPGAGSSTLAALTDTNITTPAEGGLLMWDSTPGEWVDATTLTGPYTLSGFCIFSGNVTGNALRADNDIQLSDAAALKFGTGAGGAGDILMQWDGVDLEVTGVGSNYTFNWRDGIHHRLWDSTDTDWFDMHVSGAALVITESGLTSVQWPAAGTLDLDMNDNAIQAAILQDYSIESSADNVSGTTVTFAYANGPVFECDMEAATGNVTATLSGGPPAGTHGQITVKMTQDTTVRTLSWAGGVFRWAGGTAHPITTTANGFSIYTFETWDSGTTWYAAGADYS